MALLGAVRRAGRRRADRPARRRPLDEGRPFPTCGWWTWST
ncbi:hypothetical protein ACR6C2_02425 [Streptomyces sp. INA 01156]